MTNKVGGGSGSGKGLSKKGEGWGGKESPAINRKHFTRTPFAHERGATKKFDWLLARQSKYDPKKFVFHA